MTEGDRNLSWNSLNDVILDTFAEETTYRWPSFEFTLQRKTGKEYAASRSCC